MPRRYPISTPACCPARRYATGVNSGLLSCSAAHCSHAGLATQITTPCAGSYAATIYASFCAVGAGANGYHARVLRSLAGQGQMCTFSLPFSQNGVGTLFWDIAATDTDRIWLVADVDVDGNLATANDREIYVYKRTAAGWAAPARLTNDAVIDSGPLLAVDAAGLPVLAWRHGESVLGPAGDPASTSPQTWFDDAAGVGAMLGAGRLLVGADGARTFIVGRPLAWRRRFPGFDCGRCGYSDGDL